MADMCPLSVVIVSWNTRDLLMACLDALAAPDGAPPGSEVIVVDNASTDDSVAHVRARFPQATVIESVTNSGFAAATNAGLARARGEHLLLLNSDTEVQPGALAAMDDYLRRHARVGIVGADVRNPDGSPQPCAGAAPSLHSEVASIFGLDRKVRALASLRRTPLITGTFVPHDWVLGAAMMVRRAVYETVGPLDTGYFFFSEEVDWCTRARRHGWQIGTLVGALILHHGGGSTRHTADRMRTALFQSKIRYLAAHHGRRPAGIFRSIVRAVAGIHVVEARLIGGRMHEEESSWLAVRQGV